ncbi:MAG: HU family DNA-binding protein [Deltaproteobacteria bacterium]|nr:HU family DNA-binding protein [Deltaproteobacteria bacterium]
MAGTKLTKAQVVGTMADKTGLAKKDVGNFFEVLGDLVRDNLGKKGPGQFVIPGLVRIRVVHKKATPERQGRNPATGEPMVFKAKPARRVVKAAPIKALKDSIA